MLLDFSSILFKFYLIKKFKQNLPEVSFKYKKGISNYTQLLFLPFSKNL